MKTAYTWFCFKVCKHLKLQMTKQQCWFKSDSHQTNRRQQPCFVRSVCYPSLCLAAVRACFRRLNMLNRCSLGRSLTTACAMWIGLYSKQNCIVHWCGHWNSNHYRSLHSSHCSHLAYFATFDSAQHLIWKDSKNDGQGWVNDFNRLSFLI